MRLVVFSGLKIKVSQPKINVHDQPLIRSLSKFTRPLSLTAESVLKKIHEYYWSQG